MTATFTCPCCNSRIPSPPDVRALARLYVGVKGAILRKLVEQYPAGASMVELISETYRGADEPENAYYVVAIAISSMRKLLKAHGWTIPPNRGGGHDTVIYRLQPL